MAALVVTPGNKMVDVEGTGINIEWVTTQPQASYEIQYRFPSSSTWSTCGVVSSTTQRSFPVINIYNLVGCDFYEVYYRVVLTFSGATADGEMTSTSKEISPTYSLIFRHGIKNTLKLYDGIGTREFPLFDTVSINANNSSTVSTDNIAINTSGTKKLLPLLKGSNTNKSNLNVNVSSGDTRQIVYTYANFTNANEYGSSYFNKHVGYHYRVYGSTGSGRSISSYDRYVLDTYYEYTAADPLSNKNIENFSVYAYCDINTGATSRSISTRATSVAYSPQYSINYVYYEDLYYVSESGTDWEWAYDQYNAGPGSFVYSPEVYIPTTIYQYPLGHSIDSYYNVYGSRPTYGTAWKTEYAAATVPIYKCSVSKGTGLQNQYYIDLLYAEHRQYNTGTYYYALTTQQQYDFYTETFKYGYYTSYYKRAYIADNKNKAEYAGQYLYYSGSTKLYNRGYYVYVNYNQAVSYESVAYNVLYEYKEQAHKTSAYYNPIQAKNEKIGYYAAYAHSYPLIQVYVDGNTYAYNPWVDYLTYYFPREVSYNYINGVEYYYIGQGVIYGPRYTNERQGRYTYWSRSTTYSGYVPHIRIFSYTKYGTVLNAIRSVNYHPGALFTGSFVYDSVTYYTTAVTAENPKLLFSGTYVSDTSYNYNGSVKPVAKYRYNNRHLTDYTIGSAFNYTYYSTSYSFTWTGYSNTYYHI